MNKLKHLEDKYTRATYELVRVCSENELRLYLWLKMWAINKHTAFPAYRTICADLGWSREKLSNTLKHMEASKRLTITRSDGNSNTYDIIAYDKLCGIPVRKPNHGSSETELHTSSETEPERLSNTNDKEITNNASVKTSARLFSSLKELKESDRAYLRLIARWYEMTRTQSKDLADFNRRVKTQTPSAVKLARTYTPKEILTVLKDLVDWWEKGGEKPSQKPTLYSVLKILEK